MIVSLKHILIISFFLAWLLLASFHLHAATNDGLIGLALSTGNIDIAITIPTLIRVHGLSPIIFDFDPGVRESKQINFCISGNSGGVYTAELTTNEGRFQLDDGLGNKLPYHVEFDDSLLARDTGDEAYGAKIVLNNLNDQLTNCIAKNVSLNIYVDPAELTDVRRGVYTDAMTITVAVE